MEHGGGGLLSCPRRKDAAMSKQTLQFEYMSLDDFEEMLADKPADERWELIGGRVVRMMVGARLEHNYLVQNIAYALRECLRARGSPCRTTTETFRLCSAPEESSVLPDVMVHCNPFDRGATSISNPVVLAEILSPDSEGRDRTEKWTIYKKLPSLRHYLIVSRDEPLVEIYDRVGPAWPGSRRVEGLAGEVALPALDLAVPMAEIYRDVFPNEAA